VGMDAIVGRKTQLLAGKYGPEAPHRRKALLGSIGSRRARRAVMVLGAVGAICAGAASPAGANGVVGVTVSPTANSLGWINTSGATVTVRWDVDGFSSSPRDNGDYDELINAIACSGTGVSGGNFSGPGALAGNFGVLETSFTVSGDSPGPAGVGVGCTATYERLVYSDCFSFFGCGTHTLIDPYTTRSAGTNVKIDNSPPVDIQGHPVIAPAALNWHNVATTVNFSGDEPNSFITSCSHGVPVTGPSSAFPKFASGNCLNAAGLQGFGGYTYRFDNTPPTLAPTVSPDPVLLGAATTATPHASDPHSGVASSSCDTPDTSTVGSHTVHCTATDVATNTAGADATYTVAYGFNGFSAPVDSNAVNVAKAGQAIPLKFSVLDDDRPVTDLAAVTLHADSLTCDLGETEDQIEEYASGLSGLQNLGDGNYQFNWKSPTSYAKSCKTLTLDLGDGVPHTAEFRFVK
jgi:hypothetical protein